MTTRLSTYCCTARLLIAGSVTAPAADQLRISVTNNLAVGRVSETVAVSWQRIETLLPGAKPGRPTFRCRRQATGHPSDRLR